MSLLACGLVVGELVIEVYFVRRGGELPALELFGLLSQGLVSFKPSHKHAISVWIKRCRRSMFSGQYTVALNQVGEALRVLVRNSRTTVPSTRPIRLRRAI